MKKYNGWNNPITPSDGIGGKEPMQNRLVPVKGVNDVEGYTPGEWKFSKTLKEEVRQFYTEKDKECIFTITHNETTITEALANAKLIASAPQLKKENEALKAVIKNKDETIKELREDLFGSDSNEY